MFDESKRLERRLNRQMIPINTEWVFKLILFQNTSSIYLKSMTFLSGYFVALFLLYSFALFFTLVLGNFTRNLLALLLGSTFTLLAGNLGLNLVIHSRTGLLWYGDTNIGVDIMAFFLWDSVGNWLVYSLAFLLVLSLALLMGDRLAFLSGHLLAIFHRNLLTNFLGLVVAMLFCDNFGHFLVNVLARFSGYRPTDWNIDGPTLFHHLVVHVLSGNHLAFLPRFVMTLLSGFVPTLLLGNIIADHIWNIVAGFAWLIPALLLRYLTAYLFWFIPALLLGNVIAFHGRHIGTLLLTIMIYTDRLLYKVALSAVLVSAPFLGGHVTLFHILHLALPVIDGGADFLLFLMTFSLIISFAFFVILGFTLLVIHSVTFLLVLNFGDRFLDLLALHFRRIITFLLELHRAVVSFNSLVLGLVDSFTHLLLLSVALLVVVGSAFFIVLHMTFLFILSVTFLFWNIHTLHFRNIVGLGHLH